MEVIKMNDLYYKYAQILLEKGVDLQKNQPILISAPIEAIDFIRVLTDVACKMGCNDIYFDFEDAYLKRSLLKNFDIESLDNSQFYNKRVFDEYAKKDAAILMLYADESELMQDISSEKLSSTAKTFRTSRPLYKKRQGSSEIAWCIASVATSSWANKVFPGDNQALQKLWEAIFKCCLVDTQDPTTAWKQKIQLLEAKSKILNDLNLKDLHYQNSLGTDLYVKLPRNIIWKSGGDKLPDGRYYIANIPTEEIFTSPDKYGTNGVVYSSKPLVYNGGIINDIKLVFKDGKVTEAYSKSNQSLLDDIINSHKNMEYLGEVALVDYDSPISQSNLIFYETLYDENAACHLALGKGFATCMQNGTNLSDEELEKNGLNVSEGHVDFMIGTKDLKITGITYDEEEVPIFENGNFSRKLTKQKKLF